MKRLVIILFFLASGSMTGQIAPEVLPILNEWKNEARRNNLFVDGIIAKNLGGIEFVTVEQMEKIKQKDYDKLPLAITTMKIKTGLYGYVFAEPTIYIQEKVKDNPIDLKYIIWHELWHVLGGRVHRGGITGEYFNEDHNEQQYWNDIKNLPPNAYWKKNDNTYY